MNDFLDALECRGRLWRCVVATSVCVGFACSTVALAAGQAALELAAGGTLVTTVALVAGVWLAWTWWHSIAFGRHRLRYLRTARQPYLRAFLVDLVPGLTVSFSQMLRPVLNGPQLASRRLLHLSRTTPVDMALGGLGLALSCGALLLFWSAWRVLGTARVGFVAEFRDIGAFTPTRNGLYGHVRHPLFWSGIFGSCGLALLADSPVGLAVAVLNLAYGVAYNSLEDRRLQSIFGARYGDYAKVVPHIVPARLRWRRSSTIRAQLPPWPHQEERG